MRVAHGWLRGEHGMSVQAVSWVIDCSKHKAKDFLVLLMIAYHANSEGAQSWPSMSKLAKEARCSMRAVQYSIKRLVDSGELRIDQEAGPKNSRIYSILGMQELHPLEVQALHPRGANHDIQGCKIRQRNKEEPSLKATVQIPESVLLRNQYEREDGIRRAKAMGFVVDEKTGACRRPQ